MRIFLFVILLLGVGASTASAGSAPYELKGYQLGMTLAEFKQAFKENLNDPLDGAPYCSDEHGPATFINRDGKTVASAKSPLAFQPEVAGAVICSAVSPRSIDTGSRDTLAGGDAIITYSFISENGGAPRLYVIAAKFVRKNYKAIELALMGKYGEADRSNPGIVGWQNGQDAIALIKNGTAKDSILTIGNGRLTVLHETRKNKLLAQKSLSDF